MKLFTSNKIEKIAGISKIQRTRWTELGILTPLQDAKGRGTARIYDLRGLIEALICKELNRLRMETNVMFAVTHYLENPVFFNLENEMEEMTLWDALKTNHRPNEEFLLVGWRHAIPGDEKSLETMTTSLVRREDLGEKSADYRMCITINLKRLLEQAFKA